MHYYLSTKEQIMHAEKKPFKPYKLKVREKKVLRQII